MPIVLGVDLGTTKISALAVDTYSGAVMATCTAPNQTELTSAADKAHGKSEWDAPGIAEIACRCLRTVSEQLDVETSSLAGLGITGQQHGVVLVDDRLRPITPLINWQDRRANQAIPGGTRTYVQEAVDRAGPDAPRRTGCKLAAGYMGTTLFWMKATKSLPQPAHACFLMDYFAALLTGRAALTDPTCAASSGLFNVVSGDWDPQMLDALDLPVSLFPAVGTSGELLGGLTPELADATALPVGLPVFVGIGDNQASFLGSVGNPTDAVLVNVGTGGQVAAYSESFFFDPLLETRPFPRGGYLLVAAGLSGGAAYAVLERFFQQVGKQLFGLETREPLFAVMNQLAAEAPAGTDGLRCEPFFAGIRARPELRASWTEASVANFTPAHMTRSLLEGMARTFRSGYEVMRGHLGSGPRRLVGAGNGLRENPLLARMVAEAFDMPMHFSQQREEAAYGAALLAGALVGPVFNRPLSS